MSLQSAVYGGVTALSYWVGDWTVIVPADRLLDVMRHLRDAPAAAFDMLSDVTATDWPPRKPERFDLIYCLWSTRQRRRLRVKIRAAELQPVPSVSACGRRPTGSSARCSTCSASTSQGIPIAGGS